MAAIVFFYDKKLYRIELKNLLLSMGCGAVIYATASLYYMAMKATSVSTAVVLMYTAPIFVMIYSVIFFKEKFTKTKAVAVVCVTVGSCLVSGIIGGFKFDALGILMGLGSGIAYSIYNILTKMAMRRGCDPLSMNLYCFLTMCVLSIIFSNPSQMAVLTAQRPAVIIPLMIGIGVFTCIAPYFMHSLGLKQLPAGTAATLGIVEPMAATLFSVFLFNEKLDVLCIVGIVLILFAVVLLSHSQEKG